MIEIFGKFLLSEHDLFVYMIITVKGHAVSRKKMRKLYGMRIFYFHDFEIFVDGRI